MNYSKQCELVKEIMENNKTHPTAEMVYSLLHEEHPNISLATVYRNLNKLASMGSIAKITIPNASDRFDSETKEHYHMICTTCGLVVDCELKPLSRFDSEIQSETGFKITSHLLVMYGICKDCDDEQN